jgi:hypothetical protein
VNVGFIGETYLGQIPSSTFWTCLEGSCGSGGPDMIVTGHVRDDLLEEYSDSEGDSDGDSEGNAEWGDTYMIDEHEMKELAELYRKLIVLE